MLLRKTYGIDLGSSSIKVYSFFKNKSYMEKNMIASKGRRIIAVGNEACQYRGEFADGFWYDSQS